MKQQAVSLTAFQNLILGAISEFSVIHSSPFSILPFLSEVKPCRFETTFVDRTSGGLSTSVDMVKPRVSFMVFSFQGKSDSQGIQQSSGSFLEFLCLPWQESTVPDIQSTQSSTGSSSIRSTGSSRSEDPPAGLGRDDP